VARITVINDSSEFLAVMNQLVGSMGHVMAGFDAVDASLDEVVATHPDVLIIDLRLEDKRQAVSGWELLALARAHRDLQSVPVILCTADTSELERRAAELEHIANVHVRPKPFAIHEMTNLIDELLPRTTAR
jgi:DNA-binding response OmpR family regulator